MYLTRFQFPDREQEDRFFAGIRRTCYDSFYPFRVLTARGLTELEMEEITILYGGNGSGKSTALNAIAETLGLRRDTLFNRSSFFGEYTTLCRYETGRPIPADSRIITSDDVFDFMLNVRHLNEGVDRRREDLLDAYVDAKYNSGGFQMRSLEDYDRLKQVVSAQKHSQSQYVRENLNRNVREHSNGESAFQYFTEKIQENGLYLLDEPENSLAPALQRQLVDFLSDSARFFGCQFLIATHSPFLLAMRGAKIYDLDADPVRVRPWTDLPGIRAYYDFFREHAPEFDGP